MENYFVDNPWTLFLLLFWVLPWKGFALWRSAQNNQKWWFIAIFVLNTLGILPIVYLFYFSKKNREEEKPKEE